MKNKNNHQKRPYDFIKVFFYLTLALFFSCSNIANDSEFETITFTLPDFSEDLYSDGNVKSTTDSIFNPQLNRWLVEIYSQEIRKKFYTVDSSVTVKVHKNEPLCILATPITSFYSSPTPSQPESENSQELENSAQTDSSAIKKETIFFKPAGALYPYTSTKLSWSAGFSANLMKKLWNSQQVSDLEPKQINDFISGFNWKKLQTSIDDKIQQSLEEKSTSKYFYNPWLLDEQNLLENLSFGIFKTSYLTLKSVYSINTSTLNAGLQDYSTDFLSSFVPENQNFQKKGLLSVKKNTSIPILSNNQYLTIVNYSSEKNISVSRIWMPIYKEEL